MAWPFRHGVAFIDCAPRLARDDGSAARVPTCAAPPHPHRDLWHSGTLTECQIYQSVKNPWLLQGCHSAILSLWGVLHLPCTPAGNFQSQGDLLSLGVCRTDSTANFFLARFNVRTAMSLALASS